MYSGNDHLFGGRDEDHIIGGRGDDEIDGGQNDDVAIYQNTRGDFTVTQTGDGGYYVIDNHGPDGSDTVRSVETLRYADIDFYVSNGNTGIVYNGSAGADVQQTTVFDDIVYGGGGDDQIDAQGGNDRIYGGDGDDQIVADGTVTRDGEFGSFQTGNDMVWGGLAMTRSTPGPAMTRSTVATATTISTAAREPTP